MAIDWFVYVYVTCVRYYPIKLQLSIIPLIIDMRCSIWAVF